MASSMTRAVLLDGQRRNNLCGFYQKIVKQPAEFRCRACQNEFTMDDELTPCPRCGSVDIKVTAGDEFTLKSIEIEK